MRDQFNFTGDFRSAVLNINSSLDRASQRVVSHQDAGAAAEHLKSLLSDLRLSLEASAIGNADDAEALAIATTQLVEAAVVERPNRSLIRGAVQAVLSGGKSLLEASPKIATTVNQIIDMVQRIQDLSDG